MPAKARRWARGTSGAVPRGIMGVVTIITFFVMLPLVAIALSSISLGFMQWVVLAMIATMGIGSLIGMLRIIEPERREQH